MKSAHASHVGKNLPNAEEATPDLDFIVPPKDKVDAQDRSHRQAMRALSSRWGERHRKRVEELAKELGADSPDAGADEKAIHRLTATCTAVAEHLGRAQLQLAERLERFVDDPKNFVILAKSLREVTLTQASTMRTAQELLSAAATVRAQRRLVNHHARSTWHAEIGGAPLPHARRDPPARSATPN